MNTAPNHHLTPLRWADSAAKPPAKAGGSAWPGKQAQILSLIASSEEQSPRVLTARLPLVDISRVSASRSFMPQKPADASGCVHAHVGARKDGAQGDSSQADMQTEHSAHAAGKHQHMVDRGASTRCAKRLSHHPQKDKSVQPCCRRVHTRTASCKLALSVTPPAGT